MTQIASGTYIYPFCADYSAMATCLFAIQNAQTAGAFNGDAQALELLRVFEQDVLRKLYIRTLRILETINKNTTIRPGDFTARDFLNLDFNTGNVNNGDTTISSGDFEGDDFFDQDFYVGFLDTTNTGYSSSFQIGRAHV